MAKKTILIGILILFIVSLICTSKFINNNTITDVSANVVINSTNVNPFLFIIFTKP